MRYPSIETRTGTFLPEQYWLAHEFCFFLHDVMARLLQAGERSGIFKVSLALMDDERRSFEETDDILDWVMEHRSPEERSAVLVTTVFPAVLSDMLHCVYETLETSRKAKLNVSYMLLRKPIQESLYLLETAVADRVAFATKLSADPLKLWSQGAGGCEAHTQNIALVLGTIKEEQRFDAGYLAQLRYDKAASDGFDGACNRAIHLFTGHKSIKTEAMNINFIFSNAAAKETQWAYLYSRLPYILAYAYQLVEHICEGISPTVPDYLDEIQRRLAAYAILWDWRIEEPYRDPHLEAFAARSREWLQEHCRAAGFRSPNDDYLERLIATGAMPGETRYALWRRHRRFQIESEKCGSAGLSTLSALQLMIGLRPII